jgi:hypothetical protein
MQWDGNERRGLLSQPAVTMVSQNNFGQDRASTLHSRYQSATKSPALDQRSDALHGTPRRGTQVPPLAAVTSDGRGCAQTVPMRCGTTRWLASKQQLAKTGLPA